MATSAKVLPPKPRLQTKSLALPRLAARKDRSSSVAAAKANLSSLLKSVEHDREEITLLRRGVPVARLVPIADSGPVTGYGWMQGTAHELGDIVGPTGEEWDAGNE
jgi:prevent-host-death family protein